MGDLSRGGSLKWGVARVVELMLAIGLCGVGGGFDTHVTHAQIVASYCGAGLGLASLIGLIVGNVLVPRRRK